ncbi:sigma-70 family RNA polymerase sigma factor [Planctomycetales bacterium ZRK34]|nr:sigma-70 family RNA polymerase sigma factor [Planctomycetales bacterium ZRK34]
MKRLATLWASAYPHLYAFVLSGVRDFHDAEDLTQQAAIRIAERFDQYDPSRPFLPWAIQIARNLMIDHYNRSQRVDPLFSVEVLDRIAATQQELHEELDASRVALHRCLGRLKDRARRMLELYYRENQSAEQIAQAMSTTVNAVWLTQSRSRATLRECIQHQLARNSAS